MAFMMYFDPVHVPWLLVFVYCHAQTRDKPAFWNLLNSTMDSFPGPILSIGDFNDIITQFEKYGGTTFASTSNLNDLCNFMTRNGLANLGFSGWKYTWSNKRLGARNIRERLDRGVANIAWTNLFPDARILHLPIHSSDHAPLELDTNKMTKPLRTFKLEEFWTRDHGSLEVVKEVWSVTISGPPDYVLNQKLKAVKTALKIWNMQHFGHIQTKIKELNHQLSSIQN